jgi:hypothetical protein
MLPAPDQPVPSPASEDLVGRALDGAAPLHVVALGAPTNVAAAILAAPEIRDRILEARSVERDAIFTDLFRKLDQASSAARPATGAR